MKRRCPSEQRRGRSPPSSRMCPSPSGPTRAIIRPGWMVRSISDHRVRVPKDLDKFPVAITMVASSSGPGGAFTDDPPMEIGECGQDKAHAQCGDPCREEGIQRDDLGGGVTQERLYGATEGSEGHGE